MFCGNCGTKLKEGAAFCQNCGTPVMQIEQVRVEEPNSEAKVPEQAKAEEPKAEAAPKEKQKGNKGAVIVLAVLLLLVIAAGGVAAGLYFTGSGYKVKKNMKLAQQCFGEEEYEDALAYYEEVLGLDETMAEAYINSAEIYVLQENFEAAVDILTKGRSEAAEEEGAEGLLAAKLVEVYKQAADYYTDNGDYSQAYKLLQKGAKDTGEQELTDRLADVYLAEANQYLSEGNPDFSRARDILKKGWQATGNNELENLLVDSYKREADQYIDQDSYYQALSLLDEGAGETGDASLETKKIDVYEKWAYYSSAQGEYQEALRLLDEGAEATGEDSLTAKKAGIYTQWAEDCKEAGNYTGALEALEEGISVTKDASLTEQKNHLKENLQVSKTTAYDGASKVYEIEYDENGNVTKSFTYSDGSMGDGYETEYDAAGNKVKETQYEGGFLSYIMTYDENGNPKDQTWYDLYGEVSYYETALLEYDQTGNVEWIIWSGEEEYNTIKIQKLYDEAGNLLAVYRYGWGDSLLAGYEYQQDGQIAKITSYNGDQVLQRTDYTYITTESGESYTATDITYDDEGNIDFWEKYEYEFDDMGNVAGESAYYGYAGNYDETMSNGYPDYQWTYKYEYRYTAE